MQQPLKLQIINCLKILVVVLGLAANLFAQGQTQQLPHLDVYKSPTCGCCTLWMDHISADGFTLAGHHPDNLGLLKRQLGVSPRYGSCHTAVSAQGFVFEGHVPARFVRQFLANPVPGSLGLSVPAMPLGSPGMEYEDRFNPYQVLLLNKDGTTEVYATLTSYEQQF